MFASQQQRQPHTRLPLLFWGGARYKVQVNGAALEVQSVALKNSSVTLGLADGALKAGDKVVVSFDVLDAGGRGVAGQTSLTAR